jgi:hypothetical protein
VCPVYSGHVSPATFVCNDTLNWVDINPDGIPEPEAVCRTLLSACAQNLALSFTFPKPDCLSHDVSVLGMADNASSPCSVV